MEENSNFYAENPKVLHVDDNAKMYLAETAKWAKFLSIVGFIGMGLMVVMGVFMGSLMANKACILGMSGGEGLLMSSISLIYIVIAALYIYPLWKLYKFATISKQAILSNDSGLLSNALTHIAC